MRKIFNLRAIFLAFVGVFAGVYFSVFVLAGALWLKIFLGVLFAGVFGLCFSNISFFKLRKVAILVFICSVLLGFFYSAIKISVYNNNLVDEKMQVTGTVTDKIRVYDTCEIVVLRDVSAKGNKLSGDMQLTIYTQDDNQVSAGQVLSFEANVKSYALTKQTTVFASIEKTGVKYFASANFENLDIENGSPNFFENIRLSSRKLILENTKNEEMGNLIYSVIFGDKTYISSSTYNVFSASGTAHLLAVSGLHVGFIVGLILIVLGLLKLNKTLKFIIICVFLVLYNVLCGFSSSVVRASIMTVFLLLSYLFGEKYDPLTALGLSGLIILAVKPLMAFDLGFQLSFGSVFGIICFAGKLTGFFRKIKLPKLIAEAVAVCLASTLGTLPFTAIYFHKLAYIGIISNILVIPLFGVIYSFTFLIFLLALIFPIFARAYVASEIGFVVIYKICEVFSVFAGLRLTRISFAILVMYPASMFITEFAFISENVKKHLTLALLATLSLTFALSLIPQKVSSTVFAKLETNANVLTSSNGDVLIVTQEFDSYEIEKAMDQLYLNNLDSSLVGIVVTDKAQDLKDVYSFADRNKTKIYINSNNVIDRTELSKRNNIEIIDISKQISSFTVLMYDKDFAGKVCAMSVNFDDFHILFLNNLSLSEVEFLNFAVTNVDVCVCNRYKEAYNSLSFKIEKFIAAKTSVEIKKDVIITNENVSSIYALKNKKLEARDEIC